MDDGAPGRLIARLPRTWPVFFATHGRFTPAQRAAMPPLLDGANVVLCAATASGKTEAALAPLIERFSDSIREGLTILYLTPTKALVNDLARRLYHPLERLRWRYAVKTHDLDTFDPARPVPLLLTTPESLDALLVSSSRTLATVQGVILDELHLLDSTPRGDQLRVVLNRLRAVRDYACRVGDTRNAEIQYAALSATLPLPEQTAARYFPDPVVVNVSGRRAIDAELIALNATGRALHDYLATFRERGWRKALLFCNSRAEVEHYAALIREGSPFGEAVYVHYSNFTPDRRREIEEQFARAEAALCVASSTLELGIDIGSIDVVLLVGAPGNTGALVQRVGRGGRRRAAVSAALFYRTPLEEALFRALLQDAAIPSSGFEATPAPFRPSVAVQQLFSMIVASPTGAVRLAELERRFAEMLSRVDLEAILGRLIEREYVRIGRPGDYTAGGKLNLLVDRQATLTPEYSLYSNLALDNRQIEVRDQQSGRQVARVGMNWLAQHEHTLEGRTVQIEWVDDAAVWVRPLSLRTAASRSHFQSTRPLLALSLAQQLKAWVGWQVHGMILIKSGERWLLWHFMGDLYGQALIGLLRHRLRIEPGEQPGLVLTLRERIATVPSIGAAEVVRYLTQHHREIAGMLAMGAYHRLLPHELQQRAVIEQFDVDSFMRLLDSTLVMLPNEALPALLTDDVMFVQADHEQPHVPGDEDK